VLDNAGIAYDFKHSARTENDDKTPAIKEETLTKEKVRLFYSMFKGRKDVYSLRSGKPSKKTGKSGMRNIFHPNMQLSIKRSFGMAA